MISSGLRQFSIETMVLTALGAAFFGAGAYMCVSAYKATQARYVAVDVSFAEPPMLPPPLPPTSEDSSPLFVPPPKPTSIFTGPPLVEANAPAEERPAHRPAILNDLAPPRVSFAPSMPAPPTRPIDLNAPPPAPTPSPTGAAAAAAPAARPPPGPSHMSDGVQFGVKPASLSQYDHFTAVYDLSAHVVYLPDGGRLEAHSGLGTLKDDPSHVDQADRGATPPHVYDLTMREEIFHGVRALRLNPVGGPSSIFGRVGLLAHTYMLGPDGDSNGCVSFKNYDAFLQAFQSGQIKHLAVVAALR